MSTLKQVGNHDIFNLDNITRVRFRPAGDGREAELRIWSSAHKPDEYTSVHGREAQRLWVEMLNAIDEGE